MMLKVRIIDAPSVPGGRALALCDENGEMLPMQTRAVLSNGVGEASEIVVTFVIDGEIISFE